MLLKIAVALTIIGLLLDAILCIQGMFYSDSLLLRGSAVSMLAACFILFWAVVREKWSENTAGEKEEVE